MNGTGNGVIAIVSAIAGYALYGYATGKVLEKMGGKLWQGFVPGYNQWLLTKAATGSVPVAWTEVLASIVGSLLGSLTQMPAIMMLGFVVSGVLWVYTCWKMAQGFDGSAIITFALLFLLYPVWLLVLAFGKKAWHGTRLDDVVSSPKPMTQAQRKAAVSDAIDAGTFDANAFVRGQWDPSKADASNDVRVTVGNANGR